MLSVADAQKLILHYARPLPPGPADLSPALLGRVLAEAVLSDRDVPAQDRSVMDGYAVRCADLPEGRATLAVVEEVTAGRVPTKALGPGQATRIMTGAPLPAGADAVVVVERTRLQEGERVAVDDRPPRPGQNVLRRGQEMRAGDTILPAGAVLRPAEIGLLGTVGRARVHVHPAPRVAVLSTGDEVVEPDREPGPGQLRNSNGPMLLAQARSAGADVHYLGIARDRLDSLRPLVEVGLKGDVLVLSGGVSAGKLDLVPQVLREAGVEARLHKVEMKPGKPVFFGTRSATLVFGLPGNPVSALVCFELFLRPALRRLAGHADAGPPTVSAALVEDFPYRTDRPTYHPAWLEAGQGGWRVRAVPWFGSADLRALASANALLVLPPGDHTHRAGEAFVVVQLAP
jgi:molybdopterin molybdotransferase